MPGGQPGAIQQIKFGADEGLVRHVADGPVSKSRRVCASLGVATVRTGASGMLFPTVDFGLFFSAIFIASWALREQLSWRKWLLLGASYAFYGAWDWRFLALLAFSSAMNYVAGRQIADSEDETHRRRIVTLAVVANLAVLGVFKYFGFFLDSLGDMLRIVGFERDMFIMHIVLPVGISFFTFQGISYVIDVYRRDIPAVRKVSDLFLFISFFPQLVAGPIVRAADFLPQLEKRPTLDRGVVAFGFALILLGLFKKMVLANYIASDLVDEVFWDPSAHTSLDLLLASYAYAVQVYCDFSAYSDIAIGAAALLGYTFKRNFDRPLASLSLQQLWQRWHISLGTFLRDYLYKNLRGERGGGKMRAWRTTFLTMAIGGFWHGAAWTFIIWGCIHGAFLVIENIFKDRTRKPLRRFDAWRDETLGSSDTSALNRIALHVPLHSFLGWLMTFHVFALSAIFFRSPELAVAVAYLQQLFAFTGGLSVSTPLVLALVALSVAAQFLPKDLTERAGRLLQQRSPLEMGLVVGLAIVVIFEISPPGVAPFIYFQF